MAVAATAAVGGEPGGGGGGACCRVPSDICWSHPGYSSAGGGLLSCCGCRTEPEVLAPCRCSVPPPNGGAPLLPLAPAVGLAGGRGGGAGTTSLPTGMATPLSKLPPFVPDLARLAPLLPPSLPPTLLLLLDVPPVLPAALLIDVLGGDTPPLRLFPVPEPPDCCGVPRSPPPRDSIAAGPVGEMIRDAVAEVALGVGVN